MNVSASGYAVSPGSTIQSISSAAPTVRPNPLLQVNDGLDRTAILSGQAARRSHIALGSAARYRHMEIWPMIFLREIGRAHVCTTVTNAHLVCRLLLLNKKHNNPTNK